MKRFNKIIIFLVLALHILISPFSQLFSDSAYAATNNGTEVSGERRNPAMAEELNEELEKHLAYLLASVENPGFGSVGGEWSIFCLARSAYQVPETYYNLYYGNIIETLKELMPESGNKPEGRLDANKGTEHSRLVIALTAIGKDVTDVSGYNLLEAMADFEYMIKQGINGPIFALIALDTHNYEIPQMDGAKNQSDRTMFIDYILENELDGGGWSLTGSDGSQDADITAMAIQALAPYYKSRNDVAASVDRAVNWLSEAQNEDGSFDSWGSVNSESIAQVIVALSSLDIDAHTDPGFVKNGNSAVDALLTFACPDGGFLHMNSDDSENAGAGMADGMATDQALYALVAYQRFTNGDNALYNMTDVKIENSKEQGRKKPLHILIPALGILLVATGSVMTGLIIKKKRKIN